MVRERRGGGLVVRAGARGQGPRLIRVLACFFFSPQDTLPICSQEYGCVLLKFVGEEQRNYERVACSELECHSPGVVTFQILCFEIRNKLLDVHDH